MRVHTSQGGGRAALAVLGLALALPAHAQPIEVTGNANTILMQRGEAAMALGDISGARNLLRRPADAGIAEAQRSLAQTYDPVWLQQHQVIGAEGLTDIDKATQLYLQAAKLGDAIASHRFDGGTH